MDLDVRHAMLNNYSGRNGIVPNQENVRDAINKAMETGGQRFHVLKHHAVEKIVDSLPI